MTPIAQPGAMTDAERFMFEWLGYRPPVEVYFATPVA
jgi:hypothetical protein